MFPQPLEGVRAREGLPYLCFRFPSLQGGKQITVRGQGSKGSSPEVGEGASEVGNVSRVSIREPGSCEDLVPQEPLRAEGEVHGQCCFCLQVWGHRGCRALLQVRALVAVAKHRGSWPHCVRTLPPPADPQGLQAAPRFSTPGGGPGQEGQPHPQAVLHSCLPPGLSPASRDSPGKAPAAPQQLAIIPTSLPTAVLWAPMPIQELVFTSPQQRGLGENVPAWGPGMR